MIVDEDALVAHLASTGVMEVLLKGHLWIENLLNQMLETEFKDPSAFNLDRVQFAAKVNLTQALGLLQPAEAVPLRLLNKLRNRLAHELTGEPTEAELKQLETSLSGVFKVGFEGIVKEKFQPEDVPDASPEVQRLRFWFYCYVLILAYKILWQKYERDNHQALSVYRILKALEERSPGATRTPDAELRARYNVPPAPVPHDAWKTAKETLVGSE